MSHHNNRKHVVRVVDHPWTNVVDGEIMFVKLENFPLGWREANHLIVLKRDFLPKDINT